MAPTLAALMLPYAVVNSFALSPTYWSMARRSQVQQQQAVVVGDLEHEVEHAQLRLVQVEHAAQQQRPHVDTVARTGWPCSPNTSHSVVGQAPGVGSSSPRSWSTAASCR